MQLDWMRWVSEMNYNMHLYPCSISTYEFLLKSLPFVLYVAKIHANAKWMWSFTIVCRSAIPVDRETLEAENPLAFWKKVSFLIGFYCKIIIFTVSKYSAQIQCIKYTDKQIKHVAGLTVFVFQTCSRNTAISHNLIKLKITITRNTMPGKSWMWHVCRCLPLVMRPTYQCYTNTSFGSLLPNYYVIQYSHHIVFIRCIHMHWIRKQILLKGNFAPLRHAHQKYCDEQGA